MIGVLEKNKIVVTKPAVVTEGLVSYYKLDGLSGGVLDSVNGYDGTIVNYVERGYYAKINQGIRVEGTGAVNLGNRAEFQLTTGTVAAWVRSSNFGDVYRGLVSKNRAYSLLLLNNVLGFFSWGSTNAFKSSGINIADDKWHRCVLTFELGGTSEVYLDGQLVLSDSQGAGLSQADNLYIAQNGDTQRCWGVFDEVPIYNRKLSQEEVTNDWNNGKGITLI